jgi:DNA processing protein
MVAPEAYAVALADLGLGPSRMAALLGSHPAQEAWSIAGGTAAVEPLLAAHRAAGVGVHLLGGAGYPARLAADHAAPAVLFSVGTLAALDAPLVSVVGTRRCTHTGREVARQFGRELAEAGVGVVSGLAAGIDGAAHEGALAAVAGAGTGGAPVGVVGSGLDVVYPRRHERLWRDVASAGVLLSEAPLGARPEPWRFPARNRILAALADVVVVVESHEAGGSMHTVRAAEERGRTIMVVPGSVRSPASAGTNKLLSEGLPPARDTEDILTALSLVRAAPVPAPHHDRHAEPGAPLVGGAASAARGDRRPAPAAEDQGVLDALGWEPTSLEAVLCRTGLRPGQVAAALAHLERDGWAVGAGGWWERVAAP